jgi:hypothetical protein
MNTTHEIAPLLHTCKVRTEAGRHTVTTAEGRQIAFATIAEAIAYAHGYSRISEF